MLVEIWAFDAISHTNKRGFGYTGSINGSGRADIIGMMEIRYNKKTAIWAVLLFIVMCKHLEDLGSFAAHVLLHVHVIDNIFNREHCPGLAVIHPNRRADGWEWLAVASHPFRRLIEP